MDDEQAALEQVNRAWEWFAGMVALSATNLGIELGLFEALKARGPLLAAELASSLGLQERPVDLWAKTLVHYAVLVDAGNERVALAPGTELMVCQPRTLYNLAPSITFHARYVARDLLDLGDFFRDGVPKPPSRHGPGLTQNVAQQTSAMHTVFVSAILSELPEVAVMLAAGARVLDAGCGTANLGRLLCQQSPAVRYTGVDLDPVALEEGRLAIAAAGLGDRMRLVEGDLTSLGEHGAYDLALFFLALHEVPVEARAALARAIFDALAPGGLLLVLDETYPETLAEAADRKARMGLHFEYTEALWGSHVATRREAHALLTGAGFAAVERKPVLGGSIEIVLARKA